MYRKKVIKGDKKMAGRKRAYSRMTAIFLSCGLALTCLGCYPRGSAVQAEGGGTVHGEGGFSYRLYYEEPVMATGIGRRSAGEQSPKAEITAYSGTDTEITIPGIIDGNEVKSIGTGAFKGNGDITRVTIAEGITSIGYEAFSGCEKLASVSIPSTVTNWDDTSSNNYDSRAFENCTALRELTFTEGLKSLGQKAFMGCSALERVTVPSTIEEFRDQVFAGCTSLRELELKEGIREIGYRAFQGCTSLEEVVIPSTVECWGTLNANGIMATVHDCTPFLNCTALKKITFREGLKSLEGFQGTRGCPQVKELDIPASVENVSYAFTDCASLEKITMHEGIKTIGTNAFKGCSALREVNIPDTVTTIQASAYNGCASLERLILPPLATSLEGSITTGCTNLRELYVLAGAVKWYQALGLASDGKLYCIEGSSTYNTYKANLPESAREQLAAIPTAGAEASGSEYTYDGSSHPAATVKGTQDGDEIRYRLDDGDYQEEMPEITEPGTYAVEIAVRRQVPGEPMRYSSLRAQTVIGKRQQTIHLSDIEIEEGEDCVVTAEGYHGIGEPVFTYYLDAACTQPAGGRPEKAGEYYVRANIPETDYDLAVQSNTAKIIIHGKEMPGTEPSASSDPSVEPSTEPTTGPDVKPSAEPGASPTVSPGTKPSASPSAKPSAPPSAKPSAPPSTKPSVSPGTLPSTSPDGKPSPAPGGNETPRPGESQNNMLAKGAVFTAGKLKYKVTNAVSGKTAVAVQTPKSKKATSLAVPASVKEDGIAYSVTSVEASAFKNCKKLKKVTIGKNVATIGKNAFSGCKALKKITVKTTKLKKVGKNALKGIHKKAVIKVPKKELKKYRKLWKGKGQQKSVKIK